MSESYPNIKRLDYESNYTRGWQVHMEREDTLFTKLFSDNKYGGKQKALEKAKSHRDKLLKEHGPQTYGKSSYDTRFYYPDGIGESSTPVPGVSRSIQTMSSGNKYAYYQAAVRVEKDRTVTQSRSVHAHGEQEAFLQVCQFRKEHMRQIYPDRFDEQAFDAAVDKHLQTIQSNQK